MKSKCLIKNGKLPPAPREATRPVNSNYIGEGAYMREFNPSRTINGFGDNNPRQSRPAWLQSHAAQMEECRRKRAIIFQMVMDGKTDDEISAKTGYKSSSIRRMVTRWRAEGEDIPERKRGRKKK